ncbi:coiled-coil domain-containing protein 172 [Phodopus roborovskii]|uniref:coiled-coil domain-containing protein 172 n=1 Tax=Phodopus roborovskii TaxID=109678 RepID=UPI0021E3B488|nr:coiled-coil domain-containing protein 172 [Phodopus roborovskii]
MSLESLFQQILFTEQQAEESRRALRGVRSDLSRCRERMTEAAEKLRREKMKLEAKVQQFSEKSFLLKLLKTHENALERQCSEIMNQRDTLLQAFEATKKRVTAEEEKFIKEITDFNDEYEIAKKRDILMKEDMKMEIADLEKQANVLRGEMKSMECDNGHLQELQRQKSQLLQELFTLQKKLKVLKDEETEAICNTKYLEAEKIKVKEKPQHDAECLRLKQELELYNEDEMENTWKVLQAETQFLESTLAQKGLQEEQLPGVDELLHT